MDLESLPQLHRVSALLSSWKREKKAPDLFHSLEHSVSDGHRGDQGKEDSKMVIQNQNLY